jgi:phosphohistidine phosphatase
MEIYLVRHGIAQDPVDAPSDAARCLTEEGIEKTTRVAHEFRKRISRVDVIFHSPYLRAAETARIFAAEFPKAKLISSGGLTPHDEPRSALPLIAAAKESGAVMLVGHEPHLSSLASRLMTGQDTPLVEFKKAGIAGFESYGDLERCRLSFFLSPKWL